MELRWDIQHFDKPIIPFEYTISTYRCFQWYMTPRHPTNWIYTVILSISISLERYPAYHQTDHRVEDLVSLCRCLRWHTIPRHPPNRHCNILYISNNVERYPAFQKPNNPVEHFVSLYRHFEWHTTLQHLANRYYSIMLSISNCAQRYPAFPQTDIRLNTQLVKTKVLNEIYPISDKPTLSHYMFHI